MIVRSVNRHNLSPSDSTDAEIQNFEKSWDAVKHPNQYNLGRRVGLWMTILHRAERFYLRPRVDIAEDERDILSPLLLRAVFTPEVVNSPDCVAALQVASTVLYNVLSRSSFIAYLLSAMKICDFKECRKVLTIALSLLMQSSTIPSKARGQAEHIAWLLQD